MDEVDATGSDLGACNAWKEILALAWRSPGREQVRLDSLGAAIPWEASMIPVVTAGQLPSSKTRYVFISMVDEGAIPQGRDKNCCIRQNGLRNNR